MDKSFPEKIGRRKFFGQAGAAGLSALALSVLGLPQKALAQTRRAIKDADWSLYHRRAVKAMNIKNQAALTEYQLTQFRHATNDDESLYFNKIAAFTKTLPHNSLGEVDTMAFAQLVFAMRSGAEQDFEAIPLGGKVKLANPQASLAFSSEGADPHALTMPPPPAFAGEEKAAEMAEVYWHAVTRDISFSQYSTDALIAEAVQDLNRFTRFNGVTVTSLFRGETPDDLGGPYISQFLYKPIPYGAHVIEQRYNVPIAGDDFMTSYSEWLNIQNGLPPSANVNYDSTARFIRNGRDLAAYLHRDYTFQAFLNAGLILLGFGGAALSDSNPYKTSKTQGGFVQFGAAHVLDMVSRAGIAALKAAWFQKWYIHRHLRPEEFAGRVHNHINAAATYPIHSKLLESSVLKRIFNQHGSYLLPMVYPEGSPTHPSYPAGHATIAGACVTVLKAFFKDSFVIPKPVETDDEGLSLQPCDTGLTVGGELNKLAANISIGRDTAGVHWRSDGIEGMKLGEAVAISLLRCYKETYNENFAGFSIKKFDGTTILI